MKNHLPFMLAGLASLLFFASCSPVYYIPNTQNVPLLSSQGEVNLTVAGSGSQVEVQGAYAPVEHLGLMVNGALYVPRDEDNGNGGRGSLAELGAGYYTAVGEHFVFESYGLLGAGSVENHLPSTLAEYPNTSAKINATVFRLGVQPSFGFKSQYFTAAVSSRLMSLNYSNISGDLVYDSTNQKVYLESNRSSMLLEPALTLRGGLENVKLQVQYLMSFNLSNADFLQQRSLLSVGVNLDFN